MEDEIWKSVVGYEGLYEVSSYGRVRSLPREVLSKGHNSTWVQKGRIMRTHLDKYGYVFIGLKGYWSRLNKFVHRLVAEAFIPNPNNYPLVNHKDENKENNNVNNLEWCTYEYNSNYGTRRERISKSKKQLKSGKPVAQYTTYGELVKVYPSAQVAAEENGYSRPNIGACCRDFRGNKTAYGFRWRFVEK